MEELTKQQIVLVTLLVSFVTSIATGIVTVALMDQAPQGVTQTINRVVERTIEKVTPAQNQAAAVITKETVVVKESDLIVSAVEKSAKSLVALLAVRGEGETKRKVFLGNGLIVSKDGEIIADSSITTPSYDENGGLVPQSFEAVYADGLVLPVTTSPVENDGGLLIFKQASDGKNKKTIFIPATLSENAPKLGQTVISLGGEKLSVATGIVSGFSSGSDSSSATTTDSGTDKLIRTDIRGAGAPSGGILLNLSGEVVGLRAGSALREEGAFLPANILSEFI